MTTTKKRGDVHVIDNRQCSSFLSEFQQGRPAPSDQNSAVAPIDKVEAAALFQGIPPGLSPGETAALLAARGLKVFPCEPDSKKPATSRGFKDASTNVRLSADWVAFQPAPGTTVSCLSSDCNLAFEPGSAGLLVVDIDPKNAGDLTWEALEAQHGKIRTLEVCTPSGDRHLYFGGTVIAINKQLGRGIDTRCFGGYVLLPPSSINGKAYHWVDDTVPIAPLPQWIAEILNAQTADNADPATEARFQNWQAEGNEGWRFEFYLSLIGDHEGGNGFYAPMMSAAGAGVRLGMVADEIIARIAETARTANRCNHTAAEIADRIAKLPAAVASFQAKDAKEAAEAEAAAQNDAADADAEPDAEPEEAAEWISAADGAARLDQEVREFFQDPEGKLWFLPSPAGLGKTESALERALGYTTGWRPEDMRKPGDERPAEELILDQDLSYIPSEHRQVTFAVPRHTLAEELQDKAQKKLRTAEFYDDTPVMRGYGQDLCKRAPEARALAEKGLPIYGNLCENEKGRCAFFPGCPKLNQRRKAAQAPVGIVMHGHLTTDKWEPDRPGPNATKPWDGGHYWNQANSDVHIIDELPLGALVETKAHTAADVEKLGELLNVDIVEELKKENLLTALREAGCTEESLQARARKQELAEAKGSYILNPAVPNTPEQLKQLKPPRRLAPTLYRLAEELKSGREGRSYSLILKAGTVIAQGRRAPPIKGGLFLDATGSCGFRGKSPANPR
jgi:hypothetical protein